MKPSGGEPAQAPQVAEGNERRCERASTGPSEERGHQGAGRGDRGEGTGARGPGRGDRGEGTGAVSNGARVRIRSSGERTRPSAPSDVVKAGGDSRTTDFLLAANEFLCRLAQRPGQIAAREADAAVTRAGDLTRREAEGFFPRLNGERAYSCTGCQ